MKYYLLIAKVTNGEESQVLYKYDTLAQAKMEYFRELSYDTQLSDISEYLVEIINGNGYVEEKYREHYKAS